jgi:hypothetical protein
MIHSIQRFTTQRIPPATIAGLEPKRSFDAAPRPAPGGRPGARFEGRPAGRGFGPRPSGRPGFKPAGKSFAKHGPRAR